MIISNSRRYVFFHIPKSGGTSITQLLDRGLAWNDVIVGGTKIGETFNGDWARRFKLFKHTTPRQLQRVVGDDLLQAYFKFMFVRDPVSRFRSATQFLHQAVRERQAWVLQAFTEDHLAEIVGLESVADAVSASFFEAICRKDSNACNEAELCFKPQSIYRDLLAEDGAADITVFRLEDLGPAIDDLVRRGVVTRAEVDASNVLTTRSNQSVKKLDAALDADMMDRLRAVYATDFEVFGY